MVFQLKNQKAVDLNFVSRRNKLYERCLSNNNNNNEYFNGMTRQCIQNCYQKGPVKETIVKIR